MRLLTGRFRELSLLEHMDYYDTHANALENQIMIRRFR